MRLERLGCAAPTAGRGEAHSISAGPQGNALGDVFTNAKPRAGGMHWPGERRPTSRARRPRHCGGRRCAGLRVNSQRATREGHALGRQGPITTLAVVLMHL